ncbi:MAG: septum formation inhibitor Maf [Flavobacteriaceae bacterium]|nr:septum formation inhibitor Maf [Flavobacteriaceae bacterium]|tara:strand:- start:43718 stop:44650 length:933 start_codon:yes stop_codon:yes gene_type:complete
MLRHYFLFFFGIGSVLFFQSCKESEHQLIPNSDPSHIHKESEPRTVSEDFKSYWYSGTAELTSYQLTQARYGELREGTAVTIFVTEDFLPKQQVKANQASEETISVLKLNATKKFLTGIYPYSIMTSTFSPIAETGHALKVSNSVQEWCGHVYTQLNRRKQFEIEAHSYFEGEADTTLTLEKTWLEDELWNLIRINPDELPTGELMIIPSFEHLRLKHRELQAYKAFASLKQGDSMATYQVTYPSLERELTLHFQSIFPFEIEQWEEAIGKAQEDSTALVTRAVKLKRIRTAYWQQNQNRHLVWRDSLGL